MPITKSAKKALRQNKVRNHRNTVKKDAYKKAVKDFRKLLGDKANKGKTLEAELKLAFKTLDKAAKGGVIMKNKASRLKSRLAHAITRLSKASS